MFKSLKKILELDKKQKVGLYLLLAIALLVTVIVRVVVRSKNFHSLSLNEVLIEDKSNSDIELGDIPQW